MHAKMINKIQIIIKEKILLISILCNNNNSNKGYCKHNKLIKLWIKIC